MRISRNIMATGETLWLVDVATPQEAQAAEVILGLPVEALRGLVEAREEGHSLVVRNVSKSNWSARNPLRRVLERAR